MSGTPVSAQQHATDPVTFGPLPRSGLGAHNGHLVIEVAEIPRITLDARLLDDVELTRIPAARAYLASGGFAASSVGLATASGLLPHPLWIAACGGLCAALGCRSALAARRQRAQLDLVLVLEPIRVALRVEDGPVAARRLAEHLRPYTRSAAITQPHAYRDALRRLHGSSAAAPERDAARGLQVGARALEIATDALVYDGSRFSRDEVVSAARRGDDLMLPAGLRVQAAVAALLFSAHDRAQQGEDLASLAARVRAYEAWSGHGGAR